MKIERKTEVIHVEGTVYDKDNPGSWPLVGNEETLLCNDDGPVRLLKTEEPPEDIPPHDETVEFTEYTFESTGRVLKTGMHQDFEVGVRLDTVVWVEVWDGSRVFDQRMFTKPERQEIADVVIKNMSEYVQGLLSGDEDQE